MVEDVKGLAKKSEFHHRAQNIPLEKGVLNFELELLELTDRETGKRRYLAQIDFGSGLGQHIKLPPKKHMEAYVEIERKLKKGDYTILINSRGAVEIYIDDKSEGVKKL